MGCGYAPVLRPPSASSGASVSVGRVEVLDPDPMLASSLRATLLQALVARGLSVARGPSLEVVATVSGSESPGLLLGPTPRGAEALEATASVTLRATVARSGGALTLEVTGQGEAPWGDSAEGVGESARLARRRASERACERLADALREALTPSP